MFTCQSCGREFDLRQDTLDRYPGWTPKQCMDCRNRDRCVSEGSGSAPRRGKDLTTKEVLARYSEGPRTGVFTDGASEGNPGPGGWGAVFVVDDEIVEWDCGADPHTTNNRMELTALVAGLRMIPLDAEINVYTDSQLVVNTINKWAEGWEARGWKKKSPGPIANLELVKQAYALARQRPKVEVTWIQGHSGYRWNEYADALATAYRRNEL